MAIPIGRNELVPSSYVKNKINYRWTEDLKANGKITFTEENRRKAV